MATLQGSSDIDIEPDSFENQHAGDDDIVDDQDSDDSESEGVSIDDEDPISSTSLQSLARFGIIRQDHRSQLTPIAAASMLDRIYNIVKNSPPDSTEYVESLRLLQDCSTYSLALPTAFRLENVVVDRRHVVGKGGEVTAYRGRILGRPVVAREVVIADSEYNGPEGRRMIKLIHREAITHSQLDHPNILPFLGIHHDMEGSLPMIILPLVERGSLRDLLRGNELINIESFQRIVFGISKGVQYLHARHPPVVHGDLHPGNILLDEFDIPKLCDFGLSRIRHEVTRTHTILREGGHLRFLAPEFTSNISDRFRTSREGDIFGLSMTFFNIWTGEPAFPGASNSKVAANFRKGKRPSAPDKVVAYAPGVAPGFWDLLSEMWSQDPSGRPSSDEVVKRLEQILIPYEPESYCSICDKPLFHERYKCISCEQFNLCWTHYSQVHEIHPSHEFVAVREKEAIIPPPQAVMTDADDEKSTVHSSVRCHHCLQEIVGARFHCTQCEDVDICANCESAGLPENPAPPDGGHDSSHIMIKIPVVLATAEDRLASERAGALHSGQDPLAISTGTEARGPRSCADSLESGYQQSLIGALSSAAINKDHHIPCQSCNQSIIGLRYQCASCSSLPSAYNLCEDCEAISFIVHDPMHIFIKITRPVDRPIKSWAPLLPLIYDIPAGQDRDGNHYGEDFKGYLRSVPHTGTYCDHCMTPIYGEWFRCANCDADFCEGCEQLKVHDSTHVFLVIKSTLDIREFSRVADLNNKHRRVGVLKHLVHLHAS